MATSLSTTNVDNEMVLLERVFLRLGLAESDEQLEQALGKFLVPVLLKLNSPEEKIRKKVMELLIHVNKRLKARPCVQLPIQSLLEQYSQPHCSSFLTNFSIIYMKIGFPRLSIENQIELVPAIIKALDNKPTSHLDSLMLLVVPLLGQSKFQDANTGLLDMEINPKFCKYVLDLLLDILYLPYGFIPTSIQVQSSSSNITGSAPPGMSLHSFRRIVENCNLESADKLEQTKWGIIKFLIAQTKLAESSIFMHLAIASADTRFIVANLADSELKRIIGLIDWSSANLGTALFEAYLGTDNTKNVPADLKKCPSSVRIRLKLLPLMCRLKSNGLIFPANIQVFFESMFGDNTNSRLKTMALNFTMNVIGNADKSVLRSVSPVLLSGLKKVIDEGEDSHKLQAYPVIGMLGQKFPSTVYHNIELLEDLLKRLKSNDQTDAMLQLREGLLSLLPAYKYDTLPDEYDRNGRENILLALAKVYVNALEPNCRFIAVKILESVFPPEHVPSKFLLLLATGDGKDDISAEAFKALYGLPKAALSTSISREHFTKMPSFDKFVTYVYSELQLAFENPSMKNVQSLIEVIIFARLCLIKSLVDVPLTREVFDHPCEYSPQISLYFQQIYSHYPPSIHENPMMQYFTIIQQVLTTYNVSSESKVLDHLLECIGSVRILISYMTVKLEWLKDQLHVCKEMARECIAQILAFIICSKPDTFKREIEQFIEHLEQASDIHLGYVFVIGYALSTYLRATSDALSNSIVERCVRRLIEMLMKSNTPLSIVSICTAFSEISRVIVLPLEDGVINADDSPAAKRPNNDSRLNKLMLIDRCIDIINDNKLAVKVREKAILVLCRLSVIQTDFPHTKKILNALLASAKNTKEVEIHFSLGQNLVKICNGKWSFEGRDFWAEVPSVDLDNVDYDEENLDAVVTELLKMAHSSSHPNARQGACICLLALLKGCGRRGVFETNLQQLQNTFVQLLAENNDIVQDTASKCLCVLYEAYKSEELLLTLVKQLTSGLRNASQVSADTKLFDEGTLGSTPTGGKLTTYKELCSLASDLNKPDLIYQFMHLANHNTIWNSKKGAAYGFSSIAEKCSEALKDYLPEILPKLYRYQYDPVPNIQLSMQNIWRVLAPEPQKILDTYYYEILKDLLLNINSSQYRVRQSCCLALQDFLKGSNVHSIHDCTDYMHELWTKLFRVMDDHHESTRLIAVSTGKVVSRLCVRGCDASYGKLAIKLIEAILPPFLESGITHKVKEIRFVSLQSLSQLVDSSSVQLKPFLPKLIPALLEAAGELESSKLAHLSTMLGGRSQDQEVVDSVRASMAKAHYTTETVSKALAYVDNSILEELCLNVLELLKTSVFGTRIACSHFVTLLIVQMKPHDMEPYASKLLSALVSGLTDRNALVRQNYAQAIGYVATVAKSNSISRLLSKVEHLYFEREDDSIQSACAAAVFSIGIRNPDVFKTHVDVLVPLVFFAMHSAKENENERSEKSNKVWTDIWNEHCAGGENVIRQHFSKIFALLSKAIESPSWNTKAQAANAMSTIAFKLESNMQAADRNSLLQILINSLSGRTWTGKENIVKAIRSICVNCKDGLKTADCGIDVQLIVEGVIKECAKSDPSYKRICLECLGEILGALDHLDHFTAVYELVQPILSETIDRKNLNGNYGDRDEDLNSISEQNENFHKLKECCYITLGRSWPRHSINTQKKYRVAIAKHCASRLPMQTRSIQVSVLSSLHQFTEKLIVEQETEPEALQEVLTHVFTAIQYSLDITKHTRLRKEALNIILTLARKSQAGEQETTDISVIEYNRRIAQDLREIFLAYLPALDIDHQPEIRSRMVDIKKYFSVV